MNKLIKKYLGDSYSWDDELKELNLLGNPLSHENQTPHEKKMVLLAEESFRAENEYNRDLKLRAMNGQVGSGMSFRG